MAERLLPVRAPFGIHLQQAQIDAKLDFLPSVPGFEPPYNNLAWFVFPIIQQSRNVEVHAANMIVRQRQVNGRKNGRISGKNPGRIAAIRRMKPGLFAG